MALPWITRTRKPHTTVRVNQAHPLARDIAFFYYETRGYAASNATFYDAVTGKVHGNGSGQTAGSSTDPIGGGRSSLFTSSAKTTGTAFQNPRGADTLQQTVFGRYKPKAKPASKGAVLFYGNNSGSRGTYVGLDSNGFAIGGILTTNGMNGFAADATDHLNQWINVGGSGDGTGNGQSSVWVNGVKGTDGASGSSAGTTVNQVNIGQDPTVYFNSITAEISCFIGWNRLLTNAEHRQISNNPWQILLPVFDPKYFSQDAGGGTTVALTGVSATGSVGNLGKSVVHALTGVAGTGSVGTLGKNVSHALTGNQATGSLGTLGKSVVHALTGISGTGSVGMVSPSAGSTIALTGISATGSVGTVAAKTSHALTGVLGAGSLGTITPNTNKNVALTGVAGTGALGSLGKNVIHALTGNQATGSLGTLTPSTAGPVTLALTGIQARGFLGTVTPSGGLVDTHDGGPKRRKKHEEQKKKEERDYRERQEKRRRQIIEVFEQVIEGKVSRETNIEQVIAPAAEYAVKTLEVAEKSDFDFNKWLDNLANAERILDEYLEADDEAVLVLL